MIIRTPRLTLRPLDMSMLETAFAYGGDPDTTRLMVFLPVDSIAEEREFIRAAELEWAKDEPDFYELAIFLNDAHIGAVSLYRDERRHDTGELGWIVSRAYQGQGFASEAARALMDHAALHWGISRFIAHCDAENIASHRVMEKLGMRLVNRTGGRRNRGSNEECEELMYAFP